MWINNKWVEVKETVEEYEKALEACKNTPLTALPLMNDEEALEAIMADIEKVNHPKHYNRPNGMECIDEMVLIFGIQEAKTFCKLNAWKYRYRAADKNGKEDLEKSDWYIQKYKELCKQQQDESFYIEPNKYSKLKL